ncbi:hypothetical protein ACFQHO_11520 [Actinomadura yumaensis]|uniref:hypothetical protein n=1 Tax=Actinomadura yumaensis TaxID=111807 RepID=UPI00360A2938
MYEHLTLLQLKALLVAHPHRYLARLVTDELEAALAARQTAEGRAGDLEEQIQRRVRQVEELAADQERLRDEWAADRAAMTAERDRLEQEIAELTRDLQRARRTRDEAEERCRQLEVFLDHLEGVQLSDLNGLFGNVDFTDPMSVVSLLDDLRSLGASGHAMVIAERVATETSLDRPHVIGLLLDRLQSVRASAQARVLAVRAAVSMPLDNLYAAIDLMVRLTRMDASTQVGVLADRIVDAVPVTDARTVTMTLDSLRELNADAQANALAERAAAGLPVSDPLAVALFLGRLRDMGADAQAGVFMARAVAATPLDPRTWSSTC